MTTVISTKNLGKSYIIGHQKQDSYQTLRDSLAHTARGLWQRARHPLSPNREVIDIEEFWALNNISLDIQQGDRIGIIGRNGAGKSTLLKILSRITEPTTGHARIIGRVASLLEVGTGFHRELTGRENIFLNGAILGMTRREIKKKFDEIVAFSEVEQFLDTPVKRYSSGMYVRLAFAVAAHLEPDILIVDEVLAVGDAAFQKKCLGKMNDVGETGRTVLFVSHNMAAVERLCTRAVLLQNGTKTFEGKTQTVIKQYLNSVDASIAEGLESRQDRIGHGKIQFKHANFHTNHKTNNFKIGETIKFCTTIENTYSDQAEVRLSLSIRDANETPLISCDSHLLGQTFTIPGNTEKEFCCQINNPPINQGEYYINLAVYNKDGNTEDWITSAVKFSISAGVFEDHINANNFPVLAKFEWKAH
ncbi:ABC transporter ATP-binding protein [Thermodesulfobacteriota bacterium]